MIHRGLFLKYFVLNPTKNNRYGYASRRALLAYAEAIQEENPVLAGDLMTWYNELVRGEGKELDLLHDPDDLD